MFSKLECLDGARSMMRLSIKSRAVRSKARAGRFGLLHSFYSLLLVLMILLGGSPAHAAQKLTYYHHDVTRSPVVASDEQGEVIWRRHYRPFGVQESSGNDTDHPVSYTGHVFDDKTGLHYMGARYYDPELGRFMGFDPVGFVEDSPMSFNRYAYANNNPYMFHDPDGRFGIVPAALVYLVMAIVDAAIDYYSGERPNFDSGQLGQVGDLPGMSIAKGSVAAGGAAMTMIGKKAPKRGLWTATKNKSAAENAYRHFKDHGADFGAKNAVDYAKQTQQFLRNPPKGTLTRTRANGDVVRYDPATNTFGVMDKTGAPRTMFKPDTNVHGYKSNLEYFNAQ